MYFSARFNRPFAAHGHMERPGPAGRFAKRVGAPGPAGGYVTFGPRGGSVEARVGISFVSVGGARANLAESRGRSFDALRARARRTWARTLGRVRVRGGRQRDRRVFATSLYHALLEPASSLTATGATREWTAACTAPAAS